MARTLIIASSEEFDRRSLKAQLKSEYDILEASTIDELMHILKERYTKLSAVITSQTLQTEDGESALHQIREVVDYSCIPVIVITEDGTLETVKDTVLQGANGLITRPFDFDMIRKNLQNCISICENAVMVNVLSRDRLTDMMCTELFFEECDNLIQSHEPDYYTMACIDVDHFKVINDQYGIRMGDEVLRHVASCLMECCKETEGIACRFSADKFAMLYPSVLRNSVSIVESHQRITTPKCINHPIRIRVGRYAIKEKKLPANVIFERATVAEESIKGRYDISIAEYDDSMREKILFEQKIVNEMNDALKAGQFIPYLQPQVNHATGAIIGTEALVRWKRGEEIISPGVFVPIFERNGFIYEVDKSIWEQVCMLLRRWLDEGKSPLPISVNISRKDFFRDGFFETLCGLVEKYSIPTALLRLEITESAFSDSEGVVVAMVNRLILYGFTVEIDDFGSGYSSLNTLKDVQASVLKLDMNFLSDTENSNRSGNIVESVVRMAKWLDMAVIAEGVEKPEQADYLKSIGCYYMQGYLYAKPMPIVEYEVLFSEKDHEPRLTRLKTVTTFENSQFWNPESLETLIFNSYVGGAFILEQYKGRLELMRVNNQYLKELRSVIRDEVSLTSLNPATYLDETNLALLNGAIHQAVETKNEAICELEVSGTQDRKEYFRCHVRIIASTVERNLIYCIIMNMTEQRLSMLQVQKMEREMRTLLRSIPSGVMKYSADEKAEFAYVNRNFIHNLGYTEEEFRQRMHNSFREMIWIDDRAAVEHEIEIQEKDGSIGKFNFRIEAADGKRHWFHDEGIRVTDEDQKEWYYVTLVDITKQKENEENLRILEEEYRLTAQHSGRTIGRYDVQKMTLTITSDAAERLLLPECIPDVPFGRVKLGHISPDTTEAYLRFYQDIIDGKREGTVMFQKLIPEGWRWISAHSTTIYSADGRPVSALISYIDVTERYDKEKNLITIVNE